MGAVVHCGGEDDVVALGFGDDAFDVFDVEGHYLVYTLNYFDAVEVAGVVVLVQENPEAEGDDCTGSKAVRPAKDGCAPGFYDGVKFLFGCIVGGFGIFGKDELCD